MAIGNGTSSNLVFECVQCKQQFVNENERDTHEQKTCHKVKERYLCPKCGKHFGNQHILQLHLRVHDSEQQQVTVSPPQSLPLCDSNQLDNNSKDVTVKTSLVVSNKTSENCKPPALKMSSSILTAKKAPGLTKIRLEDCLRCDACSCIYIDKNDYNKHMKNFHRQNSPKKHNNKQRKGCRSCCKHCNCQGEHTHQSIQKERGNNNLFHYNIKDRWTKMVSRRLSKIKKEIKSDPDSDSGDVDDVMDYSHLLSQVEVKIKTEPPDDHECGESL